jgi:hypothetical protein
MSPTELALDDRTGNGGGGVAAAVLGDDLGGLLGVVDERGDVVDFDVVEPEVGGHRTAPLICSAMCWRRASVPARTMAKPSPHLG